MNKSAIYVKAFLRTDKTDAILVVGNKKMHVNKALLSYHSDYFNTLFNSEFKEREMEEIKIEDVNFEDFATLLSLVQQEPLEITEPRIPKLLQLADRFLLKAPKRRIENFIASAECFTRFQKLYMADKHHLEALFERLLASYTCREDFQSIFNPRRVEWKELSSIARMKIADKFFLECAFRDSNK